jgi:hypothetical protein
MGGFYKKSIWLFLIVVLLFSGCASPTLPGVLLTATETITPLPTKQPAPSPTLFLTDTPEPSSRYLLDKCVEISQSPAPKLQGVLVLQHIIRASLKDVLFLELETYKEHFISNPGGEYYGNEIISPSGTYFAAETFTFSKEGEYPEYYQGPIVIFDSGGNLVAKVELKQESYGFVWLNEEQILMNYPYEEDNPVVLISPFKGMQKKIWPFLMKSFYSSELIREWGFYGRHKNVYNSQMTHMLYPSIDENGPTVVLRALEQEEDIVSFSTGSGRGNWPIWSIDGEKLAIALNTVPFSSYVNNGEIRFEIFVINRNGQKLLTTNMSSLFETVHITNLSWSPNGRYIAFWYTNNENDLYSNLQLAVLDTETQVISRYCLNSGDDHLRYSPIWPPTSDYLILAYKASGDEKSVSSLLLDIFDGKAWVIKPDYEPLGWLR